jgi:hypothetical protein
MMQMNLQWLVLAIVFSRARSSERVAVWRELRARGVIALAGVHVLPARADCETFFNTLSARVITLGGEAHTFRVANIHGLDDAELISRFHAERGARYDALARDLARLGGGARRLIAGARRRFDGIAAYDYFDAPARQRAERTLAAAERAVRGASPVPKPAALDLRSRHWVTEQRPGPDALACAWLIRRFANASAMIRFGDRARSDEIAFAMPGAYFEAHDGHTAFDMLCREFGVHDRGIEAMRKLVRALERPGTIRSAPEAHGIAAAMRGWRLTHSIGDAELEARSRVLFDGVYTSSAWGNLGK